MSSEHENSSRGAEWRKDASTKEIIFYSLGGMAGQVGGFFSILLFPVLTFVLGFSPVLIGFALSITALLTLVIDAQMASRSDGCHCVWGRRRSFIFAGGLMIPIILCCFWFFLPVEEKQVESETQMEESGDSLNGVGQDCSEADRTAAGISGSPCTIETSPLPPRKNVSKTSCRDEKEWGDLRAGWVLLKDSVLRKKLILFYVFVFSLFLAIARSAFDIPYAALGMELAPSYNGRSKVVLIRQILGCFPLSSLLPWALPFCLLPVFNNLAQGAFFLSLILLFFSLLGVWFVCGKTRERYQVPENFVREPILKSLKTTVSNPEFWRLSGAIVIIMSGMALFSQIGGYLFLYYLSAEGDLMLGATRIAIVATQGALVGIVAMFVVIRMCMKRQKHEAFLFSLAMMIIGLVLQWWCLSPDRLWAIFVVPFFCSFGMSGALISLSAMYPDVTDVDELRSGMRREGMFVFAGGGVVKFFTAGTPFFAGLILFGTGFDVSAGVQQPEGVFVRMRILFSFVPALFVALAFLLMRNYPLTRKRMEEIQNQIKERELGAK